MQSTTALITGASSGMGRAFASRLLAEGQATRFILVARRADRLEALRETLLTEGAEDVTVLTADLTTAEGLQRISAYLDENKPALSYYIPAAGCGTFGTYAELSESETATMLDLNVRAVVLLTRRVIPYIVKGGHIIFLGSGSCFTALPGFNIYASSKAFILHYAKAMRYELRENDIRVTCFCPGWVDTEFLGIAEKPGVAAPASYKPLLRAETVVACCVKAAEKGRFYCVTNWYTKLQHLLSKLLPSAVMTRLWLGMLRRKQ